MSALVEKAQQQKRQAADLQSLMLKGEALLFILRSVHSRLFSNSRDEARGSRSFHSGSIGSCLRQDGPC